MKRINEGEGHTAHPISFLLWLTLTDRRMLRSAEALNTAALVGASYLHWPCKHVRSQRAVCLRGEAQPLDVSTAYLLHYRRGLWGDT